MWITHPTRKDNNPGKHAQDALSNNSCLTTNTRLFPFFFPPMFIVSVLSPILLCVLTDQGQCRCQSDRRQRCSGQRWGLSESRRGTHAVNEKERNQKGWVRHDLLVLGRAQLCNHSFLPLLSSSLPLSIYFLPCCARKSSGCRPCPAARRGQATR